MAEEIKTTEDAVKEMNIYQKMAAITTEMNTVQKGLEVATKTNKDGTIAKSYKAVSERDVLDAVKPLEAKYRVYGYPAHREIVESDLLKTTSAYGEKNSFYLRIAVTYRFVNIDKPEEFVEITSFADGIDSGDKATGKAMTYADKYALLKAFQISTGEDPDQEASQEYIKNQNIGKYLTDLQTARSNLESIGVDTHDEVFVKYIREKAKVQDIDESFLMDDVQAMKRVIRVYREVFKKKSVENQKGIYDQTESF